MTSFLPTAPPSADLLISLQDPSNKTTYDLYNATIRAHDLLQAYAKEFTSLPRGLSRAAATKKGSRAKRLRRNDEAEREWIFRQVNYGTFPNYGENDPPVLDERVVPSKKGLKAKKTVRFAADPEVHVMGEASVPAAGKRARKPTIKAEAAAGEAAAAAATGAGEEPVATGKRTRKPTVKKEAASLATTTTENNGVKKARKAPAKRASTAAASPGTPAAPIKSEKRSAAMKAVWAARKGEGKSGRGGGAAKGKSGRGGGVAKGK